MAGYFRYSLNSIPLSPYLMRQNPPPTMAADKDMEMTVADADASTGSKDRPAEQRDEVIAHQTESSGSAGGLIEVRREPQHSAATICPSSLTLCNSGLHRIACHRQLRFHSASGMGGVWSFNPIQSAQWRACLTLVRQLFSWHRLMSHCAESR